MSSSTVDRFLCIRSVAVLCLALSMCAPLAAQTNQGAIDDLLTEANRVLASGRPQEAISILNKAIEQAPAHADLYLVRARARDSIGRYDAAIDDANECTSRWDAKPTRQRMKRKPRRSPLVEPALGGARGRAIRLVRRTAMTPVA